MARDEIDDKELVRKIFDMAGLPESLHNLTEKEKVQAYSRLRSLFQILEYELSDALTDDGDDF